MKFVPALLLLFSFQTSFAQKDTVYRYIPVHEPAPGKDSFAAVHKLVKEENGTWHLYAYSYPQNIPDYDEIWADTTRKLVNGFRRDYYKSGALSDSSVYQNGRRVLLLHYYKSGELMAAVQFNKAGNFVSVEGRDSTGALIPDFVYQRQASFPGGDKAWRKYLEEAMGIKQPSAFQKGKMSGEVVVSFLVDKEGHVAEVTIAESSGHPELDKHALNIIKNSPDWNPAIQYNRNVIYRQKQKITYAN